MKFKKYLPKLIRESPTMKKLYTKYVFRPRDTFSMYSRMWLLKHIKPKINGKTVRKCNVNGLNILIDIEDINELSRSDTYSIKEPDTLEWIETYFNPKDVFYDIGANIGQYSLFAAAHMGNDCRVYSFEPAFHTYGKLNWNIYHNNFDYIIKAYNIAVSNKQEINILYLSDMHKGSSGHSFKIKEDQEKNQIRSKYIQGMIGISIDELHNTWGLETPNHIKIDVDGIEELIIQGAEETLRKPELKTILIEITQLKDDKNNVIIDTILKNGFILASKGKLIETEKIYARNYLFVKNTTT